MKVAVQHDLLRPIGGLTLMDSGAILVEIEYPYDDAFGDPAIHYFQVVERNAERVTVTGIPKELIPGTEHESDFRKRVRPIRDAFVRSCSMCRDAAIEQHRKRDERWSDFNAISEARWYAHDGTGPRHDEGSPDFEHVFADYIPTATMDVCFADGEPYLRPGSESRTILAVVHPTLPALVASPAPGHAVQRRNTLRLG